MNNKKTKTTDNAGHEDRFLIPGTIPRKVKDVFLRESRKKLALLKGIIKDGAVEKKKDEIYVLCHGYKGNAGYLGLSALEAAAGETCRAIGKNVSGEELIRLVKHLEQMLIKSLEANETGAAGANQT
jgi:hypothetical protein